MNKYKSIMVIKNYNHNELEIITEYAQNLLTDI